MQSRKGNGMNNMDMSVMRAALPNLSDQEEGGYGGSRGGGGRGGPQGPPMPGGGGGGYGGGQGGYGVGMGGGPAGGNFVKCRHCGRIGHMMKHCPSIVCFQCHQVGHMSSVCPMMQGGGGGGGGPMGGQQGGMQPMSMSGPQNMRAGPMISGPYMSSPSGPHGPTMLAGPAMTLGPMTPMTMQSAVPAGFAGGQGAVWVGMSGQDMGYAQGGNQSVPAGLGPGGAGAMPGPRGGQGGMQVQMGGPAQGKGQ